MSTPDELLAEPIRRSLWRMGWSSLRPLQEQSIVAILKNSGDLVLSAKTASGKTEAAFLPILSHICDKPIGSIRALYVGPLKALINDQFRRLEELCEFAEIPVHKWHGDVSGDKKRQLVERPGGVLLITPESLESLFINRSSVLAKVFHSLSFVVIDELHAMLGKERGTQLRSQLFRLRRHTVAEPRLVALSATIGDLNAAAKWMRPDDPSRVQILKDDSEAKAIRYRIHAYVSVPVKSEDGGEDEKVSPSQLFDDIYQNYRGSKNLVFANSKRTVEELTDKLNELGRMNATGEEFLIHHGSLSKEIREETEGLMQGTRSHTTVCSSTLELGIDIGNVRAIGQVGPCWSVSSLVQRLGRSGRRDDQPHQMRVFIVEDAPDERTGLESRLYPDLLQSIALTELMLERWVESPNVSPFDLSTLVQQTLSIIAETGGATAATLFELLIHRGAFRFLNQRQYAMLLRGLKQHDLIEQHDDGTLILGLLGEKLVRHYDFYAAFVAPPEYRVLCSGRMIGRLSIDCIPQPKDHLILAGRRWQVVDVDHEHEEVLVRAAQGRKPPLFPPSDGDVAAEVRQKMRLALREQVLPAYVDSTSQRLLADARREAANVGLDRSDIVKTGETTMIWFPWTSSRVMRTLGFVFGWAEISAQIQTHRLAFEISMPLGPLVEALRHTLSSPPSADKLSEDSEKLCNRKWDRFVDPELLRLSFAADSLDIDGSLKCLAALYSELMPGI